MGSKPSKSPKGVALRFSDGGIWVKSDSVSCKKVPKERQFEYIATIRLDETDLDLLASKKITKFMVHDYETILLDVFADIFSVYMKVIKEVD